MLLIQTGKAASYQTSKAAEEGTLNNTNNYGEQQIYTSIDMHYYTHITNKVSNQANQN